MCCLQAYFVVDQCDNPYNKLLTFLGARAVPFKWHFLSWLPLLPGPLGAAAAAGPMHAAAAAAAQLSMAAEAAAAAAVFGSSITDVLPAFAS